MKDVCCATGEHCERRGSCHPGLARIFLSLLFVIGGAGLLMNFENTTGFVAMGLKPFGLAGMASLALIIAIILKLGGGLMLLFGYRIRLAANMLIVFVALTMVMYHLQWGGENGQTQMTTFFKNLAIIGGLLLVSHTGDCCVRKEESKA